MNTPQPCLFPPDSIVPLCRPSDPGTSHEAAIDIESSGARSQMMRVALDLITEQPGRTAAELEAASGLLDGKVRKRLNDLRHAGLARVGEPRRCTVTGKRAQVWHPVVTEAT